MKDANGTKGLVTYNGIDLTDLPSHRLIGTGLMYIPQNDGLFEDMTIEDNLKLAVLYLKDKKEVDYE